MSLVLSGIATLTLSHVDTVRSVALSLGEITIAVMATLLAIELASDSWRGVVFVSLVLLTAQRLWYLLFEGHNNWPLMAWVLQCGPPIVILLSLSILSRLRKGMHTDTSRPGNRQRHLQLMALLKSMLFLCTSVTLLFSTFDLCLGMDLFGMGLPVLVSSFLALAGSLATILFALNPAELHRRTFTIVLVALTLAMRTARALDVMLEMDLSGWIAPVLVAFCPLVAILVAAVAYPLPRTMPEKTA